MDLKDELVLEAAYADTMRDTAAMWKALAEQREELLLRVKISMTLAAGGELRVGMGDLIRAPEYTLHETVDPRDNSTVLRVERS